jgi:hypothetical protein
MPSRRLTPPARILASWSDLRVVEGSGSDELAGITDEGDFVADPSGKVNLKLTFS